MAAPIGRPAPCAQLVEGLCAGRQSGLDFDEAWDLAWALIIWPHDTTHRRQWKVALRAGKVEYEAAYLGLPTRTADLMRDLNLATMFARDDEVIQDAPKAIAA